MTHFIELKSRSHRPQIKDGQLVFVETEEDWSHLLSSATGSAAHDIALINSLPVAQDVKTQLSSARVMLASLSKHQLDVLEAMLAQNIGHPDFPNIARDSLISMLNNEKTDREGKRTDQKAFWYFAVTNAVVIVVAILPYLWGSK